MVDCEGRIFTGIELSAAEPELFPQTEFEGAMVPEAYSYRQDKLPHLHGNEAALFPRAVAAPDKGDRDLEPEISELEAAGLKRVRGKGASR